MTTIVPPATSPYKKFFEYKDFSITNKDGEVIIDETIKPKITALMEDSFNEEYIIKQLIAPLLALYNDKTINIKYYDYLFHAVMNASYDSTKYTHYKRLMHIQKTIIKNQNNTLSLYTDSSIKLNTVQIKSLLDKLSYYEGKKIDNILVKNKIIRFDEIDMKKTTVDSRSTPTLSPITLDLLNSLTIDQYALFALYNMGIFKYYNHVIDVSIDCNAKDYNGDKYYCNRVRVAAIKLLEYTFLTEIAHAFIEEVKKPGSSININNVSSVYGSDSGGYDCNSIISVVVREKYSLKNDIKEYIDRTLLLTSTLNIEQNLLDHKYFKGILNNKLIKTNEIDIKSLDQNNFQKENIVRTLEEKNKLKHSTLLKNRLIMLVIAVCVLAYIGLNMAIFVKYIDMPIQIVFLVNLIVLIAIILYKFINILKTIMF